MKKIYLLAGTLISTMALNAQFVNQKPTAIERKTDNVVRPVVKNTASNEINAKAAGVVLWDSDFSTPADWTVSNGGTHTDGEWAIVNSLPASYSSVATSTGTFDFAAIWDLGAHGDFALVDSDASGSGQTQETYISTGDLTIATDIVTAGGTVNDALSISWTEFYRHFQESNYVEVSNDGGATWDQYLVNDVEVNTNSQTPGVDPDQEIDFLTVNAPAGGWSDVVRVRFFYQGTWDWFWAIDDVSVSTLPDFDLKLVSSEWSFGGVQYHSIPLEQIQPALFSGNVLNNGSTDLTDVILNVDVNGSAGASSATVATFAPAATDSLFASYTPGTAGTYDFAVSFDQNEVDDIMINNAFPLIETVTVGGTMYAADNGSDDNIGGGDATVDGTNASGFEAGNYYDIFSDDYVQSVTVGIDTYAANEGQEIYGVLYQLNAGAFDFVAQTSFNQIFAADLGADKLLWFDDSVQVVAGNTYFLAVGCTGDFQYKTGGIAIDQTALIFYGTMANPLTNGNFFTSRTPVVRMGFEAPTVGINENSNVFGVSVYPNPAAENATVKFELANATDVEFNVTDLSGKVIFTNNLGNVTAGAHTLNIPTADMANGVYLYNFIAGETVVSEKLVVKK